MPTQFKFRVFVLAALIVGLGIGVATMPTQQLSAQSITAGDITGVVRDPSGAIIPGAAVTLTSAATGSERATTTDQSGAYRFALLRPGTYTVTATAPGFSPKKATAEVTVGQVRTANLDLQVGAATQTVTVTAEAAPVQTTNGDVSTSFSPAQVALVPNSGGDITATVQSAPGAVMNTQAGYGNFSTFGLPATSNLFTINGMPDNDPFLNLNNSGATNLTLGQNDVQEVSVVNNGYSGQYGTLAGANVNYVTKSGSNQWHGNAIYNWNGRVMNANNFFNNASGAPRPFDNANQWQASFGGYIVKDKTFFFIDTEGLNVLLPTNIRTRIPSPAFEAATLANLAATGQAAQAPFYNSVFNLSNGAPGAARATAIAGGGCGTGFALPGGAPCALQFQSTAGNKTHEWDLAGRVDQVISATSHLFVQLSMDRGVQATFTDPINSIFNVDSVQPQYQGQANWTYSFGPEAVNELVVSASHYQAIFGANPTARSAALPMTLDISGGLFTRLGGEDYLFPQGRNVAQYGVGDNYSVTHGAQTWKAGVNYKYNFVNDYDPGIFTTPLVITSLPSLFAGTADSSQQAFPKAFNQPVRVYNLGGYLEDDVRLTPGLHLTLALRAEHNSNPVCAHSCFARLTAPFTSLTHDAAVPYSSVIQSGLRAALPGYEQVLWEPRIGLAWTPFASQQTVLRGGFGLFHDSMPATAADSFMGNSPISNSFVVTGPLSPGVAGGVIPAAAADNAAFLSAFNSGGTLASITAAVPAFTPPGYFSTESVTRAPRYQEWNLELQQGLGPNSSLDLNYVGNHGIHEPVQVEGFNAFAPGFVGLPSKVPDARFGTITQLVSGGGSNYNGLTVSFQRRFARSLQFGINYTWSHALDDVSNGGFLPFNFNTNESNLSAQDPYNIRANYGNADYDIRHYLSLNYVWQVPFANTLHWGPDQLWRGWTISGTLFTRSGLPFTVIDSAASGALAASNYGISAPNNNLLASVVGPGAQTVTCTVGVQCLNPAAFSASTATPTGFGHQTRNQFRGPHFFDTDLSIIKNTQFPGWEQAQLGLGVQFFNLFNHPNFDQPVGDIANASQFGTVINTVSVPTSILGSFLGGDASPRVVQLTAKITF